MQKNDTTPTPTLPSIPAATSRRRSLFGIVCLALVGMLFVLGIAGWFFGRGLLEKHEVSVAADAYWHALETRDWATLTQYLPSGGTSDTRSVHGGLVVTPAFSPDMRLPGPDQSRPNTHVVEHRIDSVQVIDSTHASVTVAYRLANDWQTPSYSPTTPSPNRNSWTPSQNTWSPVSDTSTENRSSLTFCYKDGKWRLDGTRIPWGNGPRINNPYNPYNPNLPNLPDVNNPYNNRNNTYRPSNPYNNSQPIRPYNPNQPNLYSPNNYDNNRNNTYRPYNNSNPNNNVTPWGE